MIAISLGLLTGVQPASADSSATCESGFDTRVPALEVHGFNSNPDMWRVGNPSSMENELGGLKGVYVTRPFNYEVDHFEWVTNPNIGPKLADTIDCLSQASLKNGGRGKVIIVAHSMGGLAVRFAANQTVSGRKVADELGAVFTLGTPNTGTLWGNAATSVATSVCQGAAGTLTFDPLFGLLMTKETCLANLAIKGLSEDSRELRDLPPFPASVPVRAIAGSVGVMTQLLFTSNTVSTNSDMVVGVNSAVAQSAHEQSGGGRFVFNCFTRIKVTLERPFTFNPYDISEHMGECWHNEMVKTGYIQESVTNGIREYLTSLPKPPAPLKPPTPYLAALGSDSLTLFNRLTIPRPNTWDSGMSEPDTVMNFVDHARCAGSSADCPHFMFYNLASSTISEHFSGDPLKQWAAGPCMNKPATASLEGPAKLNLGGQAALFYRQRCGTSGVRYAWSIPSKQLLVVADPGVSSDIIDAALERVQWK